MKILMQAGLMGAIVFSNLLFAAPPSPQESVCPKSCACANQSQFQKLLLTPEQKEKIMQIITENLNAQRILQIHLDASREQIEALVTSNHLDEKNLDRLIQQQTVLVTQRMKDRALAQYKIYNLLTPEQKVHFKEIHNFWKFRTSELNQLKSY